VEFLTFTQNIGLGVAALRFHMLVPLYRGAILSSATICTVSAGPDRTNVGFGSCSGGDPRMVYRYSRRARAREHKCAQASFGWWQQWIYYPTYFDSTR